MACHPRIDHAQRLLVITGQDTVSQAELARALTFFKHPDFPADYDVINVMNPKVRVEIDWDGLVEHALERQRTLSQRASGRQVRYAFVDAPDALKSLMKMWSLFFPKIDQTLLIRFFDTREEALAWLGREPFDEDALERFYEPGV